MFVCVCGFGVNYKTYLKYTYRTKENGYLKN